MWQLAAYIEVDLTEREREEGMGGWGGWGCIFVKQNVTTRRFVSVKKQREVSLIAGETCIPLEFNESGAGVRLCE